MSPNNLLPAVDSFVWAVLRAGTLTGAIVPFEDGKPMIDRPREQVARLFAMLRAALEQHGLAAQDLVQAVFYVTDMALREAINTHWDQWPGHAGMSRAVIGTPALAIPGLAIEVTFTAARAA